jgi:hypothetical protein
METMMRKLHILAGVTAAGVAGWALAAPPKPAPRAPARPTSVVAPPQPVARYAMDVGTNTGLAAMAGGNGRMGVGGAMSMMMGGGSSREAREVRLRLGSSRSATGGAPQADHFFLPPAKLGKSVPLLTPERAPVAETGMPPQLQRPKGRMLIFWGCGEHAPKGQPVVIDFAKMAAGQMPPNLFSTRVPIDRGPSLVNSATYGEWPNRTSGKQPDKASSLIGAHRVASSYAPEIGFTLAQDYMPGLFVRNTALPSGGVGLSWNNVAAATGYYAWTFGATMQGNETKDLVWWSSSNAREFGGGLWDWLPPATVSRLVGEGVVLPTSASQCTIPAEVKAASASFMMGNMVAYGPEANFAYPPRPASGPWRPEWTARVRFRANTSFFVGGPPGMPGSDAGQSGDAARPKKCRGGLLGAALGAC